jgi:hypothetical protein
MANERDWQNNARERRLLTKQSSTPQGQMFISLSHVLFSGKMCIGS